VLWSQKMSAQNLLHIPISQIWEYSRESNRALLSLLEWDHLMACERCVTNLWLCHASDSIEHIGRRLNLSEFGIPD
jgi:hypothetical protein